MGPQQQTITKEKKRTTSKTGSMSRLTRIWLPSQESSVRVYHSNRVKR
jgi:hypothetical protein